MPSQDATDSRYDKWHLYQMASDGAAELGLGYRQIEVLRALLTFHPQRQLDPLETIVFPSNATLSQRLGGMPESTLRRHLARLVQAGLIDRRDSPNRKRFARGRSLAFGFDLSPLVLQSDRLRNAADAVRIKADRLAELRLHLRLRLQQLASVHGEDDRLHMIHKQLRRKLDEDQLADLDKQLTTLCATQEMSGTDIENERHIDQEKKSESYGNDDTLDNLNAAMASCTEYQSYLPRQPMRHAGEYVYALGQSLGLSERQLSAVLRKTPWQRLLTIIILVMEKARNLRNPASYLMALVNRDRGGTFNFAGALTAVRREKLSADNFLMRGLTPVLIPKIVS